MTVCVAEVMLPRCLAPSRGRVRRASRLGLRRATVLFALPASALRRMIVSAACRRTPHSTWPGLPSLHGRSGAHRHRSPDPGGSIGAPWFARPSGRLLARLSRRRSPDLLDVLIAAGCFAAFSGPVLAGLAAGAGSRPAIALFSVLASAPLIVRVAGRSPHWRSWSPSMPAVLCSVSSSLSFVSSACLKPGHRDLHGR